MPTVITRYINSASAFGGDGTSQATSGTNRAYQTIAVALSASFAAYPNLTGSDVQLDLLFDGTSSDLSTTGNMPAFATDATRFIRVSTVPSARHAGYFDSNKVRMTTGIASGQFYSTLPAFTRFEDVMFELNASTGYASVLNTISAVNSVVFDRCVIHKSGSASQYASSFAFDCSQPNTKKILVRNCVATGNFAGFFKANYGDGSSEIGVYNNTINGANAGIDLGNTTNNRARVYNNLIELRSGSTGAGWVSAVQLTGTNITNDNTSPQTGLRNMTATYVNAAGYDCRLDPSDTVAKDQGSDRSADSVYPFSVDVLGNSRSGTWDIGAYELQGGAVIVQGNRTRVTWIG